MPKLTPEQKVEIDRRTFFVASAAALASHVLDPAVAGDLWVLHGDSTDIWGMNLTPDDINSANFGVIVGNCQPTAVEDHWCFTIDECGNASQPELVARRFISETP